MKEILLSIFVVALIIYSINTYLISPVQESVRKCYVTASKSLEKGIKSSSQEHWDKNLFCSYGKRVSDSAESCVKAVESRGALNKILVKVVKYVPLSRNSFDFNKTEYGRVCSQYPTYIY